VVQVWRTGGAEEIPRAYKHCSDADKDAVSWTADIVAIEQADRSTCQSKDKKGKGDLDTLQYEEVMWYNDNLWSVWIIALNFWLVVHDIVVY